MTHPDISLSDSVLMPAFSEEAEMENKMEIAAASPRESATSPDTSFPDSMSLLVTQEACAPLKGLI